MKMEVLLLKIYKVFQLWQCLNTEHNCGIPPRPGVSKGCMPVNPALTRPIHTAACYAMKAGASFQPKAEIYQRHFQGDKSPRTISWWQSFGLVVSALVKILQPT